MNALFSAAGFDLPYLFIEKRYKKIDGIYPPNYWGKYKKSKPLNTQTGCYRGKAKSEKIDIFVVSLDFLCASVLRGFFVGLAYNSKQKKGACHNSDAPQGGN